MRRRQFLAAGAVLSTAGCLRSVTEGNATETEGGPDGTTEAGFSDASTTDDEVRTESETETETETTTATPEAPETVTSGWSMPHAGPANQRYADVDGVRGDLTAVWTFEPGDEGIPLDLTEPVFRDGTAYVASNTEDTVWALDPTSGTPEWSVEVDGPNDQAIIDGTLVVAGDAGVRGFDPESGDERWTADVDARYYQFHSASDGTAYVVDGTSVYAIDVETGDSAWRSQEFEENVWGLAVRNGTICLTQSSNQNPGKVVGLDADDGTELWRSGGLSGGGTSSAPSMADGRVFAGDVGHMIHAFGVDDGSRAWAGQTNGSTHITPAVGDSTVYAMGAGSTVYAFGSEYGSLEWQVDTGTGEYSSPAVTRDTVYVGTEAGVHGFDRESGDEVARFEIDEIVEQIVPASGLLVATSDTAAYGLVGTE